jgi:hypothetical protein
MKFLDTSLRLKHDTLFGNFSQRFPEAKMALWCMNANEMLYIKASCPEEVEEMVQVARELLNLERVFIDGSSAVAIINI